MTREEAKALAEEYAQSSYIPVFTIVAKNGLIDKIFDHFENKDCAGCIHKPEKDKNYRMECGDCSRFYSDGWEK